MQKHRWFTWALLVTGTAEQLGVSQWWPPALSQVLPGQASAETPSAAHQQTAEGAAPIPVYAGCERQQQVAGPVEAVQHRGSAQSDLQVKKCTTDSELRKP